MSDYKKVIDGLMQQVAELKRAIDENKANGTKLDEDRVASIVEKRIAEAAPVMNARRGGYVTDEEGPKHAQPSVLMHKSNDHKVIEFQKWNDNCVLMSQILGRPVSKLKYFQKNREVNQGLTELAKAMDSATTNEGLEWIPTDFSQDLYYKVHLATKVAGLFPQIDMPSNPYKVPVVKTDAQSFLAPENTADVGNKFTATTPQTNNITFTASKIATRVLFSEELNEDSITPVLDFVKNNIALAVAFGLEDALINGDNSTTHMDADVSSSSDVRKAWKGLRKAALSIPGNNVDLGTFTTANIRAIRSKMGKYGVDPAKLAMVVSTKDLIKMLGLAEVITMEKYGANATILTGELGRLDNIPIIVSEKMREDLNATGVNDSTTNVKGAILMVYVPSWLLGVRRQLTVRARFDEENDQTILVNTWRGDFESWNPFTTEPVVNIGYNIGFP